MNNLKPYRATIEYTVDEKSYESIRTYFFLRSLAKCPAGKDWYDYTMEAYACKVIYDMLGKLAFRAKPSMRELYFKRCVATSKFECERETYNEVLNLLTTVIY